MKKANGIRGYSSEEILGKHFSVFYTPEDNRAGTPLSHSRLLWNLAEYEKTGWRVRKSGDFLGASVIIEPIYDNGRPQPL